MNPFPSTAYRNALLQRTVELIPLVEIYLIDGSYAYVSDRPVDLSAVSGRVYHARLVDWTSVTMSIDLTNSGGTPSSNATFTLSNVDRTMDQSASSHLFARATVVFRAYSPAALNDPTNTAGLDGALRVVWIGFIEDTSYDDQVFQIKCRDGFFDLTLPLPRRRFARSCEWEFDDGIYCPYSGFGYTGAGSGAPQVVPDFQGVIAETGAGNFNAGDFGSNIGGAGIGSEGYVAKPGLTSCDKSYGDQPGANGCLQHAMVRFFGGQRYVTSWARGHGDPQTDQYVTFSSDNETIFDQGVPLVYCNPFTGFTINPTIFQWRPESQYMAAECVVCAGPIGQPMPGLSGNADYTVNAIGDVLINSLPPHAGQNPSQANFGVSRSAGRIGEQLLWDQISGDLAHSDVSGQGFPNVYFSGLAGFFARVKDTNAGVNSPNQSDTGSSSAPDTYAQIKSGRRVWIYQATGPGTFQRTYNTDPFNQGGNGNPAWIVLDMLLEAFNIKYSIMDRHLELVDMQSFIDAASYYGETIAGLTGDNVMRYWWAGQFQELAPATDQIDAALRDCHSFRFFRNGKIAIAPFSACQPDTWTRPAFQEFVNIKQQSFKPVIPKPEYNEVWLNFADHDFDFQKNVAQIYSQPYQILMGLNGHPFKVTKTLNLTGTPFTEQATRLGIRLLGQTLGGATKIWTAGYEPPEQIQWTQLREVELVSTFMMTELEVGDVTYIYHSLLPVVPNSPEGQVGGDWFRISAITVNKDWTVTFKMRSWRASNYDDILDGVPYADPAKFPHALHIPSGLGIVYGPNPQLQWADVDPIAAMPNVGLRLTWQLYANHADQTRLRFVNIYRSTDNQLAAGGYLLAEVDGYATTWLVATPADFDTNTYRNRCMYLCGGEQIQVTGYVDNGNGTANLTVVRAVNSTGNQSHQKYDIIRHISFLDQLPNPAQVQALVSETQYVDPYDTSAP
jgi:hypothetical protein